MVTLNQREIIGLYQKRARNYDWTANLYYALGFREQAYRKKAVAALGLKSGDTVVELGCGTGLNFSLLEEAVGREGRIIGVDLTAAMIEQAQQRVARKRWKNVELIQQDIAHYAHYQLPSGVNGILSTLALTLVPEYDEVIKKGYQALAPGGKLAVLDLKLPDNALRHLAPLALPLVKMFGVQLELAQRHPWESLQKHFPRSRVEEHYGGLVYLAVGEK